MEEDHEEVWDAVFFLPFINISDISMFKARKPIEAVRLM